MRAKTADIRRMQRDELCYRLLERPHIPKDHAWLMGMSHVQKWVPKRVLKILVFLDDSANLANRLQIREFLLIHQLCLHQWISSLIRQAEILERQNKKEVKKW